MNIIPGEGPRDAKIVIVGEAWGTYENRARRPFMGPAGELLNKIMQMRGIQRGEVYLTNVIREQPPNNDISKFISFDYKNGVSMSATAVDYVAQLMDELSSMNPNVIVPLGNVPLYVLTGKQQITKRRGSVLVGDVRGKKVKVIPTIHPAAALRQYIWSHFISFDFGKIKREAEFPDIRLPERSLKIRPTFFDAMSYLQECSKRAMVGVDIEVVNEEVSCIAFALSAYDAICIPFREEGHDYFTLEQEMQIWRSIARVLEDPKVVKLGQNFVFDSTFNARKYGIHTRNIADTMVAVGIAYPDFPKGLDFITSIWTEEPYYKDEGKKHMKYGGPEYDFWVYNAKDACVCMEAYPRLLHELERQGNLETYMTQVRTIEPLVYMQERGTLTDTGALKKASEEAEAKEKELTGELRSLCGYDINPNSPQQLKEYFYVKRKAKPYINRKTGEISTDRDALKRLSRKGFREASILLETRRLAKLRGTYFDMQIDSDSRIRCAFNPVGTKTGRFSSSKTIFGTGGNMQNLPPEMLRYMLADEGCVMYNLDLSQAENRIVAYIAPEPAMIAAFEKKIDIHSQTGALISGLTIDDVKKQDKEGVFAPLGDGQKTWRFWGKKSNHSFNYDLGYKAFAYAMEMEEKEAKWIIERYHHVYPGVRQYHAWVRAKLSKDRTIENLMGRKRTFMDRWGDELFKEAYAQIPQSSVADIVNRWGINYLYYNQELFRPVDLLNQVHDAIVLQMSHVQYTWTQHADCLMRLKDSLERPLVWKGTQFVIPVDVKMGLSLNKKMLKEVNIGEQSSVEGLARELRDIYEKVRTAPVIQDLGGNISDSWLSEEEVLSELGDPDLLP